MNIASQVSNIGSDSSGVGQAAQISVLNKAKNIDASTVLPLLDSAVQSSQQIQATTVNPAHLGQNVDVHA
ncbi:MULTISPECIES: putative motility protein [unclassified Paludibacterium]|uniref:putative motility protein n=1 Tax=unclassified Paludibacterium TaxID=2618429 RepID=UPI00207B1A02|nr:putative motility protein [Paludibacterium sp. B53371]BEV70751.1 hypothetical protein THUN1379_02330 [Paludibacterium sp. THUN1379]